MHHQTAALQKTIRSPLFEGVTVLAIAHRLHTIAFYDKVALLDKTNRPIFITAAYFSLHFATIAYHSFNIRPCFSCSHLLLMQSLSECQYLPRLHQLIDRPLDLSLSNPANR